MADRFGAALPAIPKEERGSNGAIRMADLATTEGHCRSRRVLPHRQLGARRLRRSVISKAVGEVDRRAAVKFGTSTRSIIRRLQIATDAQYPALDLRHGAFRRRQFGFQERIKAAITVSAR